MPAGEIPKPQGARRGTPWRGIGVSILEGSANTRRCRAPCRYGLQGLLSLGKGEVTVFFGNGPKYRETGPLVSRPNWKRFPFPLSIHPWGRGRSYERAGGSAGFARWAPRSGRGEGISGPPAGSAPEPDQRAHSRQPAAGIFNPGFKRLCFSLIVKPGARPKQARRCAGRPACRHTGP